MFSLKQPALDVEASVTAEGLNVGFFESRGVLGKNDIEGMMESLKTELLRVAQRSIGEAQ